MRSLTEEELQKIRVQEDLLQGNINRMCVTKSLSELDNMAFYARKRIETIQSINHKRFKEEDK